MPEVQSEGARLSVDGLSVGEEYFRLTKPEGENDTEQRPSTEAGDSDADTERSRSLGAGQISDRVGGRLIEEEK